MRVSANACWGKRLCAIVSAQSQDCASVLCNLRILRIHNAISRLCKFSDCAEHVYWGLLKLGIVVWVFLQMVQLQLAVIYYASVYMTYIFISSTVFLNHTSPAGVSWWCMVSVGGGKGLKYFWGNAAQDIIQGKRVLNLHDNTFNESLKVLCVAWLPLAKCTKVAILWFCFEVLAVAQFGGKFLLFCYQKTLFLLFCYSATSVAECFSFEKYSA